MAKEDKFKLCKSKHEDAIERMIAILYTIEKDNPRASIIQQVIELGEWALEKDGE